MIRQLELKNVRCFADSGPIRLAPLTFLIGENSTGKSTFLAAYRVLFDVLSGRWRNIFNDPPFQLGAYEEIACFKGGRFGRAEYFELLGLFDRPKRRTSKSEDEQLRVLSRQTIEVSIRFCRRSAQPEVDIVILQTQSLEMTLRFKSGHKLDRIVVRKLDSNERINFDVGDLLPAQALGTVPFFNAQLVTWILFSRVRGEEGKTNSSEISRIETRAYQQLIQDIVDQVTPRPYAIAPVRTRPLRTYDPTDDTPDPEGGHVPFILRKASPATEVAADDLIGGIGQFGRTAGLFKALKIRKLGRHESDPFQISVEIAGPPRNIADVGYGVSQTLPIIVDVLNSEGKQTFLVQQPEVHLHPRAQAALGSFFVQQAAGRDQRFIVETHSDYILDRVRFEVKKGSISHRSVSFAYFERQNIEVKITNIRLDENGNLLGVPPSYRQFFLEEEMRFMGVD